MFFVNWVHAPGVRRASLRPTGILLSFVGCSDLAVMLETRDCKWFQTELVRVRGVSGCIRAGVIGIVLVHPIRGSKNRDEVKMHVWSRE